MTRAADLADLGSAYGGYNGFGFRNALINGGMQVSQRGSSFSIAPTATAPITLDRWGVYSAGATLGVTRGAGDGDRFPYSLEVTGAAGSTACNVFQRIESSHASAFVNRPATLSARIYLSAPKTVSWYIGHPFAATDNYAGSPTVTSIANGSFGTLPAGWNTVSVTVENLGANAYKGLEVCIFTGGVGAGETFRVTGVQFELGREATPFEFRPQAIERLMCQRYYQRGWTGIAGGEGFSHERAAAAFTGQTYVTKTSPFVVPMRTAPSVAIYAGGAAGVYVQGVTGNDTGWLPYTSGLAGGAGGVTIWKNNVTIPQGGIVSFDWTADAEL